MVYTTDTVTERSILHHSNAYGLFIKNNKLQFFVRNDSGTWLSAQTSVNISTNTWYYAIGTYDGTTIKIYLQDDTTPSGQTAQTGTIGRHHFQQHLDRLGS